MAFVLDSSVDHASCDGISVRKFSSTLDNIPFFFHFSSYSILDAITFIGRKITIEISMWTTRVFCDGGFNFCFQFFRSVDLNQDPKRCLKALTFSLSFIWA